MGWLHAYNLLDDLTEEKERPDLNVVYLEIQNPEKIAGRTLIAHRMMSEAEVDAFVDLIKRELEEFGKDAKEKLRKAKGK